MLSRFHLIPERNGQTNGQTDRFAISISRVSMLTRDKNDICYKLYKSLVRTYSTSIQNKTFKTLFTQEKCDKFYYLFIIEFVHMAGGFKNLNCGNTDKTIEHYKNVNFKIKSEFLKVTNSSIQPNTNK